uniref:Ovule protein n=2 Tax=Caenorhabditis tropicalis TaxID=1561998 RepID=A0A1I7UWB2_9PELO
MFLHRMIMLPTLGKEPNLADDRPVGGGCLVRNVVYKEVLRDQSIVEELERREIRGLFNTMVERFRSRSVGGQLDKNKTKSRRRNSC